VNAPAVGSRAPRRRVALQPIWTTDGELVGHEYLYRTDAGEPAGVDRWPARLQDEATAAVLDVIAHDERLPRTGSAFVNITRAFFVDDLALPVSPGRLVLEIVESVTADDSVLLGLRRMRARGFRIAIDDFEGLPHQVAMLPFADYVKIDCRALLHSGAELIAAARRFGARLVAEHVSTPELVEACTDAGFELLQGNALGPASTTLPTCA
jgi:EAL and modified HD-GYP domain-containing signal transduction protein